MWSFAAPLAFLLLPLPLLARRFLPPVRAREGAVVVPPALAQAATAARGGRAAARLRRVLPVMIWLCLVTALAGPRVLELSDAAPASGRDIVLAIDLSGSMEKEDFSLGGAALSRLDAVKRVGAHFVRGRAGDRVGLVVFGDKAYFAAPLTFDTEAVAQAVEGVAIGVSGRSTALSEGLGLAVKRLATSEARSRIVIFLSDGVDTTGQVDALGVAALARQRDVRVHTIALGPDDLESDPDARDAVDSATLRAVAERSGGETFRVRTLADLSGVATAIDALEPSPSRRPPLEIQRDYWFFPAMAALFLSVLHIVIGGWRA